MSSQGDIFEELKHYCQNLFFFCFLNVYICLRKFPIYNIKVGNFTVLSPGSLFFLFDI